MNNYTDHNKKIVTNRIKREKLSFTYINHELSYNYNNNNFKIMVKSYPFKAPTNFKVNNKVINYNEISKKYSRYLNKYFGIRCFCCRSKRV